MQHVVHQPEAKTQRPKPPSRRWRNRYEVLKPFVTSSGHRYDPGEHSGRYVWPSRELAEEAGARSERVNDGLVLYLGALQEPDQDSAGL
ncbi:MAG: hypothetical protein AB7P07_02105 [Hyphomonadaceae bacterium]